MADGKYSIDDILNEYSEKPSAGGTSKLDIDAIIGDFDGMSAYTGNDVGEPAVRSDEHVPAPDTSRAYTEETAKDGDKSFEEKYAKLGSAMTAVKKREKRAEPIISAKPSEEEKRARSFSDKFEQGIDESGEAKTPSHRSFSDKFEQGASGKSDVLVKPAKAEKKKQAAVSEAPIQSIANTTKNQDDPFEKYSSIGNGEDLSDVQENAADSPAEDTPVRDEAAPAARKSELDDILSEYSSDRKKPSKNENTQHKSITEFFTRLIPKPDDDAEDGKISGNTELLDGMLRAKKERVSRTQHIAPIERKSISDIDLNLDDKIMQDTAKIPSEAERIEQEKISQLKERRNKKIKDFVLVGDEEDVDDESEEIESIPVEIDDFENFNDAPSIAHDIAQLKGSLQLRLLVLAICFAASLYIAVANDTQALPIMELLNKRTQTNTYLFVNAILGLLAAFSSYTVISCGLSKLLSFKADSDSLCAVSIVSSIASAMIMFANGNLIRGSFVHVYTAVSIASLLFNTIGKLCIVNRTQRSFRFVSGSSEKYAVFPVEDEEMAQNFTRGALNDFPHLASMRKTEFLSEFLKTSYSSDSTDRFCRVFTPAVIAAAVVIGIIAGILGRAEHGSSSIYIGISVFVGVVTICMGFSTMLVVNLPMLRASKKNAEVQGIILGYDSIEEFADTNSILIDAEQLFPQGSVKLAAIKVFSDTRIDEAIVEAASLTTQAGSILKNMFYDIIAGKTELLNPVESYIYEDSMGLCGWINNKRVLLGSRELMINHSIEGMPPISKEKEYTENGRCAVYLSISGELSAMFLVEINPTMEVRQSLQELQKNGIYVMIRSVDSLVSINRLSELFEISPEYLKLIPFRVHEKFAEVTAYQEKQRATLACSGRFAALSSLILSCRYMKTTIGVGIALQAVAMMLGALICLVMVILNSFQEISASMLMMYNFIFTSALVVFQLLRKN